MNAPSAAFWIGIAIGGVGCESPRCATPEPPPNVLSTAALRGIPAVVVGTVLEAATGKPVRGAVVSGPGGSQAVSDERGRFELAGLFAGMQGTLVAREGRLAGENRLRPLEAGRLEVVIFLR